MRRIILASGSPRRRELLAQTGLEFEVMAADVDENAIVRGLDSDGRCSGSATRAEGRTWQDAASTESLRDKRCSGSATRAEGRTWQDAASTESLRDGRCYPARVVETLSKSKAEAVAAQIPEGIVIGADTIVWDDEILGKPADRADAYRMLRQLQGRTHSVFTGVTVLVKGEKENKTHTFHCETQVDVYPMSEQETQDYLDTGEPMDKAGAYGIQGKFGLWVKEIRGDYNCVVGLPLSALWQVLKQYV